MKQNRPIIECNARRMYYIRIIDSNGAEIFFHRSQYAGRLMNLFRQAFRTLPSGAFIDSNITTSQWDRYMATREYK